jgi:glyoxylase-like metal-dependent hydrolase (beta-lactamase superfamily II)
VKLELPSKPFYTFFVVLQSNLMTIIPLSEGSFTIDKTKQFVPFNPTQDDLLDRSSGSLLVEVQPFCIITDKDVILLDTGLGFSNNGQLQLHKNLIDNGIPPERVTKVLLSHLHKDHAGGISYLHEGEPTISFDNATYYVHHQEFEVARQQGFPSFIWEEIAILENHIQLVLLPDEGTIDGYIKHQVTHAHSPQHQVFWIEEDGEIIFFGGDDAPQLKQMKNKFVAKYDFDGKKSMQLRQQWWQQGAIEKWKFLFYHDIETPVAISS